MITFTVDSRGVRMQQSVPTIPPAGPCGMIVQPVQFTESLGGMIEARDASGTFLGLYTNGAIAAGSIALLSR